MSKEKKAENIRVTLLKGLSGRTTRQKSTVRGLGLKRIGDTSLLPKTKPLLGMVEKVKFMLKCEEVKS